MIKPDKWQRSMGDASPYLSIGISLAGAMLVYVGMGYLIDRWLGTSPKYLIVGSVAGMISFFVQLVRLTKEMTANQERIKAEQKKESEADKSGPSHSSD